MVLMKALDHKKKSLVLLLVNQRRNFASVYVTIIILCLMENKSLSLKVIIKMLIFQLSFVQGAPSFGAIASREVSLKGNVYDFPVDYDVTDISGILNIHKYLLGKNNIK